MTPPSSPRENKRKPQVISLNEFKFEDRVAGAFPGANINRIFDWFVKKTTRWYSC